MVKHFFLTKEVIENLRENFTYLTIQKYVFNMFLTKELTENAFKIYCLLFDRAKVSAMNNYCDENGNIYVYYTYEQFKETMDIKNTAIVSALKLLEEKALIKREKGFNSSKIYLGYVKDGSID
jgi:hypothetical protein